MSKAVRADIRQVLRSRAEIYGDELDPKWFKSMSDLGTRAKSLREKNPSPTRGAPILLAQLVVLNFRKKMLRGKSEVSQNLKLCTVMALAEVLKTLSKAPP